MAGPPASLRARLSEAEANGADAVLPVATQVPVPAAPVAPQLQIVPKAEPAAPQDLSALSADTLDMAAFAVADQDAPLPVAPPALTKQELTEVRQVDPQIADRLAGLQGSQTQLQQMLQEQRDANKAMKAQLDQLTAQRPPQALAGVPVDIEITAEDLTDVERSKFNPESLVIIEKLAKRMLATAAKPLTDEIKNLQAQLGDIQTTSTRAVADVKATSFQTAVQQANPDIRAVFANEAFKTEFLSQPLSDMTDETIGERLKGEWENQNVQAVNRIMNNYKTWAAKQTAASVPGGFKQPATGAASSDAAKAAAGQPTTRPVLKYSLFKAATQQRNRRALSPEKFSQIQAMYQTAEAEGRIDYNQ